MAANRARWYYRANACTTSRGVEDGCGSNVFANQGTTGGRCKIEVRAPQQGDLVPRIARGQRSLAVAAPTEEQGGKGCNYRTPSIPEKTRG